MEQGAFRSVLIPSPGGLETNHISKLGIFCQWMVAYEIPQRVNGQALPSVSGCVPLHGLTHMRMGAQDHIHAHIHDLPGRLHNIFVGIHLKFPAPVDKGSHQIRSPFPGQLHMALHHRKIWVFIIETHLIDQIFFFILIAVHIKGVGQKSRSDTVDLCDQHVLLLPRRPVGAGMKRPLFIQNVQGGPKALLPVIITVVVGRRKISDPMAIFPEPVKHAPGGVHFRRLSQHLVPSHRCLLPDAGFQISAGEIGIHVKVADPVEQPFCRLFCQAIHSHQIPGCGHGHFPFRHKAPGQGEI